MKQKSASTCFLCFFFYEKQDYEPIELQSDSQEKQKDDEEADDPKEIRCSFC